MSVEALPTSNEVSKETQELEKAITERLEHVQPKNGEAAPAQSSEAAPDQLEAIRDKINETATRKSELAASVQVPEDSSRQQVYQLDKKGALKAERQKIQANLSGTDKVLSVVIHNKTVTAVSDAAAKTVARPTSLFWGGLCACLATATLYFTAKYVGFTYNYLVSFLSFVGGYLIGLVLELLLKLIRRPTSDSV